MLNSETLEVAIGMSFMFLAISLICTAAKEWLEGIFKWRAMDLERALRTLLADPDGAVTAQLMRHPAIDALFPGNYDASQLRSSWLATSKDDRHMRLSKRRNLPSYIPSKQFAVALLDCVARGPLQTADVPHDPVGSRADDPPLTVELLRNSAQALASEHLYRTVLSAIDHSAGDLAKVKANIEHWFDGTMDRASGWYKRRTQTVLFLLGLLFAAMLNVDSLHVMQRLVVDKTFREAVVSQSSSLGSSDASAPVVAEVQKARIESARKVLDDVKMPIGWRYGWKPLHGSSEWTRLLPVPLQLCAGAASAPCPRDRWLDTDWLLVVCGWLLTAFAVTLGAPFWFDLLNRFMVIRSTVKPHEKSPEEGSLDRQATVT